jgi:chromosome segregation ATPase
MASESARSTAPKKWDQVLTKVRGMLDETLARADARLEELDQLANAKPNDRLARHLEGLEQRLQRAGVVVDQTDQALSSGEKTVREYMSNVDSLRQKLVDWVGEIG